MGGSLVKPRLQRIAWWGLELAIVSCCRSLSNLVPGEAARIATSPFSGCSWLGGNKSLRQSHLRHRPRRWILQTDLDDHCHHRCHRCHRRWAPRHLPPVCSPCGRCVHMSVLWSRQNSGCSHKLAGHMPGMHLVHDQEMHIQGEGSAGPKWNPELGNSMAGEVVHNIV